MSASSDLKNMGVAALAMDAVLTRLHEHYGSSLDMEEEARDIVTEAIFEVLQEHGK